MLFKVLWLILLTQLTPVKACPVFNKDDMLIPSVYEELDFFQLKKSVF